MSDGLRLGLFDLPEFGDLLEPRPRPRKNRTRPVWQPGGATEGTTEARPASPVGTGGGRAAKLLRIAQRVPEVMVKITGTNAEASPLKAHLRYLTQQAKDPLIEDEDGNRLEPTLEGRKELLDRWSLAVTEGRRQEVEREQELAALKAAAELAGEEFVPPPPGPRRTIALHVVLSMPRGTSAPAVMQAARGFAAAELHNHKYVLVLHQDKGHPHVHAVINNIGHDLRPLSRTREDLQRWRETFARELRALGVQAEATPRKARGVIRKRENRRLTLLKEKAHAARDFSDVRVWRSKIAQAANEARGVEPRREHPAESRARQNRARLEEGMRDAIATLREQGEAGSRAAVLVGGFLSTMPPPETEMDELRRAVGAEHRRAPATDPEKGPPTPEIEKS